MPRGEEVVLDIAGGGSAPSVTLKAHSVQKWADIKADLERLFPDLQYSGGADKGFRYQGPLGREKVVNDDESLARFFKHATEDDDQRGLAQTVVLVAAAVLQAATAPATPATPATPAAAVATTAAPAPAPAPAKPSVSVKAIEFPASPSGDALLQVRPVVVWGKDEITVSAFVCCRQLPAPSGAPNSFIFSYSKRVSGSQVLELGLSSPAALKVHLKGEITETGVPLVANTWQHVVLTRASKDGTVTLYIDGNKAFSVSKLRIGANLEQGGAFMLGNTGDNGAHAFVGFMAEVSVWKCVVTREVIRKMSHKPVLTGSEDKLCLYLNFKGVSEDDSSVLYDVTSEREAQMKGRASILQHPVDIRGESGSAAGGAGGAAGGGGVGAAAVAFHSVALRFEERSFGRIATSPPVDILRDQVSVGFWVCSVDGLQSGCLLSWVWPIEGGALHRIQVRDCSNLEIAIGTEEAAVCSKVAVNDGMWHYVMMTWKSKDGALTLFVDGAERYAAAGVAQGLRLDERAANSAKLGGTGTLMLGQRLRDLSKRGVRDLEDAFFGLVAHVSIWSSALSAVAARKPLTAPLIGAEKDLVLYLNPDPTQFSGRHLTDVAMAQQAQKLMWTVMGPVDLLPAAGLGPGVRSEAAWPLIDRQVRGKSMTIEAKSWGRLALQPLVWSASSDACHLSVCAWLLVSTDKKAGVADCIFSFDCGPVVEAGVGGIRLSDSSNLTLCVGEQTVRTGCRLQAGVWHHVGLTWTAKDGAACLYLDGEKRWDGKVGKGAQLEGAQASLWVGQRHVWDEVRKAVEQGVPDTLLTSLLFCTNKAEAAAVLGDEKAEEYAAKLKELAGKALPAHKGGDAALAGAIYEWLCNASCVRDEGFVGQIAALSVWGRVLTRSDVIFVSNGALLGNEAGLLSHLELSRYLDDDKTIQDRFFDDVNGAVVGGCKVGSELTLRAGVEWMPQYPPGSIPKEAGDMCALQLSRSGGGGGGQGSCVSSDFALSSEVLGEKGPGSKDLSISFWVRSIDSGIGAAILSFATTSAPKEIFLAGPSALEIHIAGNVVKTGVAVNDGHWHHVVITWTGQTLKTQKGVSQQGELIVYLNNCVLHRGAGRNSGAANVSPESGTFALGAVAAQGHRSFEGTLACLAVFDRRLDAKSVASIFGAPVLRGRERGLRVFYDFDFDPSDEKPPEYVLNKARGAGGGAGLLQGAARLVFLKAPYQLCKVCQSVRAADSASAGPRAKRPGSFEAKCLEFKDRKSEACALLFPAEVVPERAFSLSMWVRCDAPVLRDSAQGGASKAVGGQGGGGGNSQAEGGGGTLVSYAAYCRRAFNLRVTHKVKDGTDAVQLFRVEGNMQFGQLIAKLKEAFDDLVTIRHTLSTGGGDPITVASEADFDIFCTLVRKGEEEEAASTPQTPAATAGKQARHNAVAVTTAPFKGGAKLLASMRDAQDKMDSMMQLRELSIAQPAQLEVTLKGVVCKGDVPINIRDGRWHHLALTWRSKGGCLALYVDGVTRMEKTGVAQDELLLPNGSLVLGQAQNSIARDFAPGAGFQGHIAHVGLFKQALPLPRVLRCLSAPLRGDEDGLVLLWDLASDPLAGDGGIYNSSTYVPPPSSLAASSAAKAAIKDKAALGWVDAILPGDARICGLGSSQDAMDAVTVTVTCTKLSDHVLADTSITSLFLHVVIGEEGNDQEHALRHGSFPFPKASYAKARHVQVMHVDAIGHRPQREAFEKLLINTSRDREALMILQLCREIRSKAGDVLSEVVARANIDLLKYLGEGRDEVGRELSLFAPGQTAGSRSTNSEPVAKLKVDIQALAAMRAVVAAAKARTSKSSAASADALIPEEVPKLERRKSNFSRSESVVSQTSLRTPSVPGTVQTPTPKPVAVVAATPPSAPAPAPAAAPAAAGVPEAKGAAAGGVAGAKATSADGDKSKKKEKKDDDGDHNLPDRIVLHCKRSGMAPIKVEMEHGLRWDAAKKELEKELGQGRCIEFTDAKSKKACRVEEPRTWEALLMQAEDTFDEDTGEAHFDVKVVSNSEVESDEMAAKLVANASFKAQRSKGIDAEDNPDLYSFLFDCSQLGPGWWADAGDFKLVVDPEILWDDFREKVTKTFGAAVLMSFVSTKGKIMPMATQHDFNDACDQIEDEWDEADGDGSIRCVLKPPKGGMPEVKGWSEQLLRLPVHEERAQLQALAAKLATRMQERMADVCAAARKKERSLVPASAAANAPAQTQALTSEQALQSIYACKVLEGDTGGQLLQALEKLICDDDLHLAIAPAKSSTDKSMKDDAPKDSDKASAAAASADRLVDWLSFVERFRLATPHEELVMRELQDKPLRAAMNGVFLQRHALRESGAASSGKASWDKCATLLREQCHLSEEQSQRLTSWAQTRTKQTGPWQSAVLDVLSLAEEANLVDVGALMSHGLLELAALRVLKARASVEEALLKVPLLAFGGKLKGQRKGVQLSAAVSAVASAAGLTLAVARQLLLRSASILCHVATAPDGKAADEDMSDTVVDEVVVEGWLEKLWILHPAEVEVLERARDERRQTIRRALVTQKDAVVKGIRECASEEAGKKAGNDTADGKASKAPKKAGIAGIKDAIVDACQREGVVCSLQEAQALCDEVPTVGGRRNVAEYIAEMQLVDVVTGALDAHAQDLCPKIGAFLEACERDRSESSGSLCLPSQLMQALLSVGVPVDVADKLKQHSTLHEREPVDYRDLACGRLLVLTERERQRLMTPMGPHQRKTQTARLRVLERRGHLMAALAHHDAPGRGFIEETVALSVLQQVLQLPAQDCQALLDAATGPVRAAGMPEGGGARKINYALLAGFRVVFARPTVAAFCLPGCPGCSAVGETFLSRQGIVVKALRQAAARWRSTSSGKALAAVWGAGVLPYSELEAVLRSELSWASGVGGEWSMRHLRSVALAQPRLVVEATEGAGGQDGKDDKAKPDATKLGDPCAQHLVRVEALSERFAVLEASDAAAVQRLGSFAHQRALAAAHGAYVRHSTSAAAPPHAPAWAALQSAGSPAALLTAITSALPSLSQDDGGESKEPGVEEEGYLLPCGDLEALAAIWEGGVGLEDLLRSLVPVYCHMLPAPAIPAMPRDKPLNTATKKKTTSAKGSAAGSGKGARPGAPEGLTRGQQVFRKLLASRRPGVMQILQAMGAMTPTCVPSPLNDATKRCALPSLALSLDDIDPKSVHCLQLSFVDAVGVPGPGEKYNVKNRMLKLSLFDVFSMKFVGTPMSVELMVPNKEDKAEKTQTWTPTKSAPKVFVSADLKTHPQMCLYFELGQLSQRKSDTAGKEIMDVSCGHALLGLQSLPTGSSGKQELGISGGTPFMPVAIDKDMLGGGKSSGLLARLRGSTKKSVLAIKLEKVDKHILEMVNRKQLPPNTLCISDAALPIAHFQHLSRESRARSRSPDKTRPASASKGLGLAGGVPVLEDLFTRAQVLNDPVLALFPRLRESPPMMAHFSAAWAHRYKSLSDKDKSKDEVLRKLVRECTLIVWPLMKMRALKDGSAMEAAAREEAEYMKAATKAKSLGDMQSVIAGGGSSVLAHQPFRIDELLE